MMCIDFLDMKQQIKDLDAANTEYFHIDVMDGHFVPNLMLCNDVVKAMRKVSDTPCDYHFMVDDAEKMMKWYDIRPNDIVSVHIESTTHLNKAVQYIHECGAKAFVAINPGTSVYMLDAILPDIDGVLVMTVNPGFAGQKVVESALSKIAKVRKILDDAGKTDAMIEVDGNVSLPNAEKMRSFGADIFVAGTSSVFKKDLSIAEGMQNLRDAIAKGE